MWHRARVPYKDAVWTMEEHVKTTRIAESWTRSLFESASTHPILIDVILQYSAIQGLLTIPFVLF